MGAVAGFGVGAAIDAGVRSGWVDGSDIVCVIVGMDVGVGCAAGTDEDVGVEACIIEGDEPYCMCCCC